MLTVAVMGWRVCCRSSSFETAGDKQVPNKRGDQVSIGRRRKASKGLRGDGGTGNSGKARCGFSPGLVEGASK